MNKMIHEKNRDGYELGYFSKFKYLGSYRGKDLSSIKEIGIEDLVFNEIYEEFDDGKEKQYKYSERFTDEIYMFFKTHVEHISFPEFELDNCFYKIKGFVSVKDKIAFLKNKHQEIFPFGNVMEFAIYKGEPNEEEVFTNGFRSWKEYMVNYYFDFCPEVVWLFLIFPYKEEKGLSILDQSGWFFNYINENKNNFDNDFFEFIEAWKKFYPKNIALRKIEKKIQELEQETNTTTKSQINTTRQKSTKKNIDKPKVDYLKVQLEDVVLDDFYPTLIRRLKTEDIVEEKPMEGKPIGDLCINSAVEIKIVTKFFCGLAYFLKEKKLVKPKELNPEYYKGNRFKDNVLVSALNNTFPELDITTENFSQHKTKTFKFHSIYYEDDTLCVLNSIFENYK